MALGLFLLVLLLQAQSCLASDAASDPRLTQKHEAGRCAIRGQCGKQSFLGKELPCADNGKAAPLSEGVRAKLVNICGSKWSSGLVCCDDDQINALGGNLKQADTFISSCPACRENFFNLFCTFTCSPDQSTFINVTETTSKNGKNLVTELDNLWSDEYGAGFYDSCKDVKFGAANTPAMSFIGGGAKSYEDFLKFLGHKSILGSPFQINFPRPDRQKFPSMEPASGSAIPCNTSDTNYRCTCVDCGSSCEELPTVGNVGSCHVGAWPCLSFAVVLIYSLSLSLLAIAVTGHASYQRHAQNKHDRLRLLQDVVNSDDDDDPDEIMYEARSPSFTPIQPYALNTWFNKAFGNLARSCHRYPAITIGTSLFMVALLSVGWIRFSVEKDPIKLWVAPASRAAEEKAFFDSSFGPFFRAEQAFLVNETNQSGSVMSYDNLKWWFDVETRVMNLRDPITSISLEDICYKPTGQACVVQSLSGYFHSQDFDRSTWQDQILSCTSNPSQCRPDFDLPIDPRLVLGGRHDNYLDSAALITTWVVNNGNDGSRQSESAVAWETSMNEFLRSVQREAESRGLRVSFNTEISLEQELSKSTNTDARIIVISYMIMFLYVSLALGSSTMNIQSVLRRPALLLVQSKFSLGIMGIVIVLLSVSASVGLCSAFGIKVTLIIAEVIPFLVLAVGVDNIFLIVHEFDCALASRPETSIEDSLAKALGRIGPSILLSATMETVTFALGAFVTMPAVRNFAVYAAGAVIINAILQLSMFVAILSLNQRRIEAGNADCVPCLHVGYQIDLDDSQNRTSSESNGLQDFIQRRYAPTLLGKRAKILVLAIFAGLFTMAVALLPSIELGLEQQTAIPSGSYLVDYFNDLYKYFDSGPPVYFVTRELNATQREVQQQLCGRFSTCHQNSLATRLEQERKRPDVSYLASPTASWVDDFFLWLNPAFDKCCVEGGHACFEGRNPPWNPQLQGMPTGNEYMHYLQRWLNATTDGDCSLGGKAAYSNAVVPDKSTLTISASHFRSAHTPLRSQRDFIESYAAARRIANDIEASNHGVHIFPYSKHYIFFDQYLTIVRTSLTLVGSAILACLVICSTFLGSIRTSLVVGTTVTMTVVDIAGSMALAGVSLNAVTLVNLIICVGIAVEFCAHIARAFQFPSRHLLDQGRIANSRFFVLKKRNDGSLATPPQVDKMGLRAWAALSQVGGSVFSGITITKLVGVCVLAFTQSKIFEIYYFRVWLALVLLGASHALILLPVLLSWFGGPSGYAEVDAEGRLAEDLSQRQWYGDEYEDET